MKLKTTIAAAALTASSAFALIGPGTESKTFCLDLMEDASGPAYVGSCDQTKNNKITGKEILENGCAEHQVAQTTYRLPGGKYKFEIAPCLPPSVVQL